MPAVELHGALEGSGPGLVLLHPVGLDHGFWGGLVAAAARTHRVLALDLRGHGASPPAHKGLQVEDYADDVHAAIARHRLGPAVVLGLSFGGMIAQELALRHSGDVAALLLCACPGGFSPEARAVVRERGLAAERDGMAAVVEPTIERWFTPAFRSDPAVERVRERLLSDDVQGWSAAWHAIAGFEALPRLGEVRAPTVVVVGERDAATPIPAAEALAGAIPGARLTVLPDAPHMMQIERADAFVAEVDAFLAGLRKAGKAARARDG